jgi:hypothetical protein
MQEYKHRPLDNRSSEIRLVRAEKATSDAEPITLTLRHAFLDDEEPFNALSYCWGEEVASHEVVIRDDIMEGAMLIRKNLHDFLSAAHVSTGY